MGKHASIRQKIDYLPARLGACEGHAMSIYTSYPGNEIDVPRILATITFLLFFAAGVFCLADWLGKLVKRTNEGPASYPDYLFHPHIEGLTADEEEALRRGISPFSDGYLMMESMRVAIREGHNPEWCLKDGDMLHPYLETCQSITGIRYVASCYLSMLEDMSEEEL